jgi:uncharacterized membrane protein HdeD (DUF308 family)
MSTNARALVGRVRRPVTLVLPRADKVVQRDFLKPLFTERSDTSVLEPDGTRWMPLDDPRSTVLLLDPKATAAAEKAAKLRKPKPQATLHAVRHAFASTSNGLLFRGAMTLLLGIALLLLRTVPTRLIAVGFAVWVLVEGLTTIAGAVGLRRSGKGGWVPWLLVGALSFLVAWLMIIQPTLNIRILALVIAARALYIGIADLYVVRRVSKTPSARWILMLQGVIGIAIAVLLLLDHTVGARLLKVTLGVYFIATGASSIGYAFAARRSVRARVKAALAREA